MMNLEKLIRPDLLSFTAYAPERAMNGEDTIYLDANESPYADLKLTGYALNRYPQKQPFEVIKRLAEIYEVSVNQILLTRGSDEVIDLLLRLFCTAGKDSIIYCPPTFGMYVISSKLQNAKAIGVCLRDDFQLDVPSIKRSWQEHTKLIFLCSPNNPTGNLLYEADILLLCDYFSEKSIVVVDEAYIEYAERKSLIRHLKQYPNLIILRTLSKSYGLAGLRCGTVIAHQNIIAWLDKIVAPFPIPIPSALALEKALNHSKTLQYAEQITMVRNEKEKLCEALSQLSCVKKVWPSDTNFLFVQFHNVEQIIKKFTQKNILVRIIKIDEAIIGLRISIGLPDENKKLLHVLRTP